MRIVGVKIRAQIAEIGGGIALGEKPARASRARSARRPRGSSAGRRRPPPRRIGLRGCNERAGASQLQGRDAPVLRSRTRATAAAATDSRLATAPMVKPRAVNAGGSESEHAKRERQNLSVPVGGTKRSAMSGLAVRAKSTAPAKPPRRAGLGLNEDWRVASRAMPSCRGV